MRTSWFSVIIPIMTNQPVRKSGVIDYCRNHACKFCFSLTVLHKRERLKQCLHCESLAFPENVKFHSVVSIVVQLIEGVPLIAIWNCLSQPSHLSSAYSMWASRIKFKISGTLYGCCYLLLLHRWQNIQLISKYQLQHCVLTLELLINYHLSSFQQFPDGLATSMNSPALILLTNFSGIGGRPTPIEILVLFIYKREGVPCPVDQLYYAKIEEAVSAPELGESKCLDSRATSYWESPGDQPLIKRQDIVSLTQEIVYIISGDCQLQRRPDGKNHWIHQVMNVTTTTTTIVPPQDAASLNSLVFVIVLCQHLVQDLSNHLITVVGLAQGLSIHCLVQNAMCSCTASTHFILTCHLWLQTVCLASIVCHFSDVPSLSFQKQSIRFSNINGLHSSSTAHLT